MDEMIVLNFADAPHRQELSLRAALFTVTVLMSLPYLYIYNSRNLGKAELDSALRTALIYD